MKERVGRRGLVGGRRMPRELEMKKETQSLGMESWPRLYDIVRLLFTTTF